MISSRVTTILFAAMTFVAAQAQGAGPQLFNFWGEGNGSSGETGGSLKGSGQTNLAGTAAVSLTFTNGRLLGQNGSGSGTCSLENGTLQLATSTGTITMSQVGMSCNDAGGGTPNTLNATYLVTQGTGVFQGVTGTGNLVAGFSSSTGTATGLMRLDGVLKQTAP